jgi:hypothetical protein
MPPSYDKLASASAIYAYAGNDPINMSDPNGHDAYSDLFTLHGRLTPDQASQAIVGGYTRGVITGVGGGLLVAGSGVIVGAALLEAPTAIALAGGYAARPAFRYAQREYGPVFSQEGRRIYSGLGAGRIRTVNQLADALRSGRVDPSQITVETYRFLGRTFILNSRTTAAMRQAGIPRGEWNFRDMTGNRRAFVRLIDQLRNNSPLGQRTSPRPRGSNGGSSGGSGSPLGQTFTNFFRSLFGR